MSERKRISLSCSAWFDTLVLGFKGWVGDYTRLACRGDMIDRTVGCFLIPGVVLLSFWLIGDYLVGLVSEKLEQESEQYQQQTHMQEKFTYKNFATSVSSQDYLVRGDVAGEDESIDPDYDGSSKVEYESELLHGINFLPNVEDSHE